MARNRWIIAAIMAVGAVATTSVLILRNGAVPKRLTSDSKAATSSAPSTGELRAVPISYQEALPILQALRTQDAAALTTAPTEAKWADWIRQHDAAIRARLDRGDEDSIVNFWLYGTTFSKLPRATTDAIAAAERAGQKRLTAEEVLLGRLDNLLAASRSPGSNERVQFVRTVLDRHQIDPSTREGAERARQFLIEARERVLKETASYRRAARGAQGTERPSVFATLYRDRGLSSDTSLAVDFALEQTLRDAASKRLVPPATIRRVAIIGPGLDFTDKAEGFDFYPLQTIQPFAVIDSLVRVGLASQDDLRVTTFDLSPRVNQHLTSARARATSGAAYVLQLPLDGQREWNPDLLSYWEQAGDRIGSTVPPISPPETAGQVRLRAVSIPPPVVLSIAPRDLNIVVERLPPSTEQFDLIVATNVLVYYDALDQALALANIGAMLKPGGHFVSNYAVTARAPFESSPVLTTTVEWDHEKNGDTIFWYRRR